MFFSKFREYIKYLFPFILGVLIFAAFTNGTEMYSAVSNALSGVFYVLNKFLLGFGLAYIIDFMVRWMQKNMRLNRKLSIALSYVLMLALIFGLVFYMVPPVYDNIVILINNVIPVLSQNLLTRINEAIAALDPADRELINEYIKSLSGFLWNYVSSHFDVNMMQSFIQTSTRFFIDLFFGLMISVYALLEKDSVLDGLKRCFAAVLGDKRKDALFSFLSGTNTIFSQYLIGKFVDSAIVCAISLVCYRIFGLPLAPFLAIIAGFFNMIPYFGPYIGGAVTVVIMLCYRPIYAIYAVIIMVAVQLLDSFFIGPKTVGKYVGISPLFIIVAVCIGGDIGGFLGVFLSIPICATIKTLTIDRQLEKKLKKPGAEAASPPGSGEGGPAQGNDGSAEA